jgi:hypothetical protein
MLAHIARVPVEESSTPFIISAGAALVGICAIFGWSRSATIDTQGWKQL